MERLKSIRGHLVSFPLEFMCHEDLRPVFNESEFMHALKYFTKYVTPALDFTQTSFTLHGFVSVMGYATEDNRENSCAS